MINSNVLSNYQIGFDAKRAYHNGTGLGHYSRTLIKSLADYYSNNNYYLFNPKFSNRFSIIDFPNIYEIRPKGFFNKTFSSFWRTNSIKKDLKRLNVQLYHGLSHEIPVGIQHAKIKSVVTIHDLIFERSPHQFGMIDAKIHHFKAKNACKNANKIIAISQQTKQDIIDFYHIDPSKIEICYQSCNPSFAQTASIETINQLKKLYNLPQQYFLYVGSIIERKNLLNVCKAIKMLEEKMPMPLVVIGEGGSYKKRVKEFVQQYKLTHQIIFLSEQEIAKNDIAFTTAQNFPALYQGATAVIYPSTFEGFGIPVLEALWSKVPVITSNISCLPETGGDGAYYVDPYSVDDIANALIDVAANTNLRRTMIEKGWQHAQQFTPEKCAAAVMQIYEGVLKD